MATIITLLLQIAIIALQVVMLFKLRRMEKMISETYMAIRHDLETMMQLLKASLREHRRARNALLQSQMKGHFQ